MWRSQDAGAGTGGLSERDATTLAMVDEGASLLNAPGEIVDRARGEMDADFEGRKDAEIARLTEEAEAREERIRQLEGLVADYEGILGRIRDIADPGDAQQ